REEVERLCGERPELAVFKRRMEALDGLFGEEKERGGEWKLSGERRARVLEALGEKETVVEIGVEKRRVSPVVWRLAALVVLVGVPVGFLFWSAMVGKGKEDAGLAVLEEERVLLGRPEELGEVRSPSVRGLNLPRAEELEAKKPSAPSAATDRVIASESPSPAVVSEMDLGDGADFGVGWGSGGGSGGARYQAGVEVAEQFGRAGEEPKERQLAALAKPAVGSSSVEGLSEEVRGRESFGFGVQDEGTKLGLPSLSGVVRGEEDVSALDDGVVEEVAPIESGSVIKFEDSQPIEPVVVAGSVVQPGSLDWKEGVTLGEVVEEVGGVSTFGSPRRVRVYREGKMYDLSLVEREHREERIFPGDVVEVEQVRAWEMGGSGATGRGRAGSDEESERALAEAKVGREMETRTFLVPPPFATDLSGGGGADWGEDDPFAEESALGSPGLRARSSVQAQLEEVGVEFPEGASARYNAATGELVVRSDAENLDLVEQVTSGLRSGDVAISDNSIDEVLNLPTGGLAADFVEVRQANEEELRFAWVAEEDASPVREQLSNGEELFALGNYEDAEDAFREVLRTDPYHKAARRWLERTASVKSDYYRAAYDEARAGLLMEVDKAWELAVPSGEAAGGASEGVAGDDGAFGQRPMLSKLRSIVVPEIDFENTPLEEALEYLTQQTIELDADPDEATRGVSFVIENGRDEDALFLSEGSSGKVIDGLKLEDVPLGTALDFLARQAGMRYRIDEYAVTLLPLGGGGTEDLITREWKVPLTFQDDLQADGAAKSEEVNPFADGEEWTENLEPVPSTIREDLEDLGLAFPAGSAVQFDRERGVLVVKNTASNLDLVDQIVESVRGSEEQAEAMGEEDAGVKGDSTFSLNVSEVSFQLAQAALAKGEWPEEVRVEEFVNAFSYGERSLRAGQRVGLVIEQGVHPELQQRRVLRLGVKTAATGRGAGVPLRLTVVLDQSGSMERMDRVQATEEAFRVLLEQLGESDRVTLIGFSRTPRLLAEQWTGERGEELLELMRRMPAEGGTNVEEALKLARVKAREHFLEGAQNRVILLTDGIANLGNAVPEELMALVEEMREEGLACDACGVGAEGVNDEILEALARKGDGRYYLLGSTEESGADFAKQVAGALRPAAKNVKVQIEWNPERVGKWKLYGFEKHQLKKEDFRDDAVDAAEMAAEEEGVALYHVEAMPEGTGPLGVARVRFLDVEFNRMVEQEWEIPYEEEVVAFEEDEANLRLATVAALSGEKLARSAIGERVDWDDLAKQARALKGDFPRQQRVIELERMIEQAKGLN
ncbi:MAG: von Willebrand factor type A domain-containing protein, partial [Verrucomicrobiota bacterium]